MTWTAEDSERLKHLFPKPRGTVEIDHLTFLQTTDFHGLLKSPIRSRL